MLGFERERNILDMLKRKAGRGLAEVLDTAIERIQQQLASGELKGSVADLVRLLQLRTEVAGSQTQPITVRWIEE